MVLVVAILVCALNLIIPLIKQPSRATFGITGAALSVLIHGVFYGVCRRQIPDIWALAATTLSLCIILEYALFKLVIKTFPHRNDFVYALMGMCTIFLFTVAISKIRTMTKAMENHND